MHLRRGKLLWDTIEQAARQKHCVGKEFQLTLLDLGNPEHQTIGECKYRLDNFSQRKHFEGMLNFDPYV